MSLCIDRRCAGWIPLLVVMTLAVPARAEQPTGDGLDDARRAYRAGLYDRAINILEPLADGAPDAAALLARTRLMTGQYDKALRAPAVVGAEQSGNPELMCVKGELLMRLGRLDDAAVVFERAWNAHRHARSWCFRHTIAVMRGETELAADIEDDFFDLHDATPIDTATPMIFTYVAKVVEDISPAEETPDQALNNGYAYTQKMGAQKGLYTPEAYIWAGNLLLKYYAFSQVAEEYDVALKQTPDHPEANLGVARLYMEKRDFQHAQKYIDKVLAVNPKHDDALLLRAMIMISENAPKADIVAILNDQILKRNPYHLRAWSLLAAMKRVHGDTAGYESIRETVLGRDPALDADRLKLDVKRIGEIQNSPPRYTREELADILPELETRRLSNDELGAIAWSLLKAGRFHAARKLADTLQQADPSSPYAWLVQNRGLNPKYVDFYNLVGEMLELKSREAAAREEFLKGKTIAPDDWRINYNLGMCLSRLGYTKQARDHITKAFAANPYNVQAKNMKVILFKLVGGVSYDRRLEPKFKTFETAHFRFRIYRDEIEILEPYLKMLMEQTRQRLDKKWGFDPVGLDGKILVEVFPTRDDFSVGTTGLPDLPALGATFGQVITLVSPKTHVTGELPSFQWKSVFNHEYMHCISLQLSQYRIPRWATEALSVYTEHDAHVAQDQLFLDKYEEGLIPKLSEFEEGFTREKFPGCVSLHYYLAGKYMTYWIDTYGVDTVRNMMVLWGDGKTDEEVFQAAFGKSLDEMDLEIRQQVIEPLRASIKLFPSPSEESLAILTQSQAADPDNIELKGELAVELLRINDIKKALTLTQEMLDADPGNALANTILSIYYRLPGNENLDTSLEYALKAVKTDPNFFYARQSAGIVLNKMKRYNDAIPHLKAALAIYPRQQDNEQLSVYYQLASAYEKTGQLRDALNVLLALTEMDPTDSTACEQAARLAESLGDDDATLTAAMRGIYIDPYKIDFHMRAGGVLYRRKQFAEALREFHVATVIDSVNLNAWEGAAESAMQLGDVSRARHAAGEALKIRPTSDRAKAVIAALAER